jgi:glycosyltransferase involved in cell wall biosynthesis
MRAYVHDRVVFLWWAEAVLSNLMRHFGIDVTSRLFVLFSSHDYFIVWGHRVPIVTALPRRLNKFFVRWSRSSFAPVRWLFDYRNLMFFYPVLCWNLSRKIRKYHPKQVVISSFAAVKNVIPISGWQIPTILYLHSPMQYIRENYDEYMQKLTWIKKMLFSFATNYLRPRDKKMRSYTVVYTNSCYTAQCAKKYYMLDGNVRYPELDPAFFSTTVVSIPRDYFIYVGRLVRFIREVDRLVELCNSLALPLLIVGSWPDEIYLKSIAWPTITFIGHISNIHQKIDILKHARGLINLAKESCGMATMEAVALWVPVIWFAFGGSREIIAPDLKQLDVDNVYVSPMGVLVTDKSLSTLQDAVQKFLVTDRDRKHIQSIANQQQQKRFIP